VGAGWWNKAGCAIRCALPGGGVARYQYVYEQCGYDPVTRDQQVRVSFKFDDGSWMKHAFVYDWRIWPV
jgi:hypothetical protein